MRILFTSSSLAGGGAERVVARLASYIAGMGHEVSVLMLAENKITYDVDARVVVNFVEPRIKVRGIRYYDRLYRFRKAVKRINPDVVISFSAPVNIMVLQALRWSKVRTIISERNNPYVDPETPSGRKKRDDIYHLADGIVFQTEDARDYFSDNIKSKSTIIINPIDSNIPNPYDGEREKTIVSVARLDPQKNHKLLIDSFAEISDRIKDYDLKIYGVGSQQNMLQELIDSYGLNNRIKLMGYFDNVLDRIRKASLFVLPSDYEGISNSLLEALALGLPVVSTDHPIGGARLLIKPGENGLLTPVGDKDRLKAAMLKVIEDSDIAMKLSNNAVHIREVASIEYVSKRWLDFIQLVINNYEDR